MNLTELKYLDFSSNKISDIKALEKFNFEKLEKLNLCRNYISDIKIFEKLNLNYLKIFKKIKL